MKPISRLLAAAVLAVSVSGAALAETPKDTLIQAWTIDDIISLDPAEIFEFTAAEIAGNSYDRLIGYDPDNVSNVFGVVAESWNVSEDGKSITFKIRDGIKFASGNPLTAEDAVFSLQRAVMLDKSPAFIINQFGFDKDNVKDKIRQTGPMEFVFEMDKPYAPSFVLYCMTSTIASVVDKKLAMEHEKDGDFGYEWLKTNYAGSGPFLIKDWRANEVVVLERNDNYWGDKPAMKRAIYRHIPEPATQRLLLEKGDIDIARKLEPEEIKALASNPDVYVQKGVKGSIYYLGLNQKNEYLSKPEVREALKYLVDYQTIADTIMEGRVLVHQAFLPRGFLGALEDTPYKLDVAKAKELLAKAGLPDGFTITMDTRNTADITGIAQAIQKTWGEAGIKLEIIPGDGKQTLTKYRARNHDIYIGRWGPDYQDPHTNADTFAANSDNSDDAKAKPLAWRNAWDIPEMTKKTLANVLEKDSEKRAQVYLDIQKEHQMTSPFVIMFQEIEVSVLRKGVKNFILGPSFDGNSFVKVTKE